MAPSRKCRCQSSGRRNVSVCVMFEWLAQGGVHGQRERGAIDQRTAEAKQVPSISGAINRVIPCFHLGGGEHLKPFSEVR